MLCNTMGTTSLSGGSLTVIAKGNHLRELREQKGLKQREVEDAIGIPRMRLSLYERNNSPVSLYHLNKLARFYEVEPKTLVSTESLIKTAELTLELMKFHGFRQATESI
jgi:transcriptional regulator with XRE-family HTH domain